VIPEPVSRYTPIRYFNYRNVNQKCILYTFDEHEKVLIVHHLMLIWQTFATFVLKQYTYDFFNSIMCRSTDIEIHTDYNIRLSEPTIEMGESQTTVA